MATISKGNILQKYVEFSTTVTITPGSGGSVRFDCSSPVGVTRPSPRTIYSATEIVIPGGSTFTAEAFGADATYTDDGEVASLQALVSRYGIPAAWADRPDPASFTGLQPIVDVGIGGSMWYSTGVALRPVGHITLARLGNTEPSVTGVTTETDLWSVPLPADLLTDRTLTLRVGYGVTNNANNKTIRAYIGATKFLEFVATSSGGTWYNVPLVSLSNAAMRAMASGNISGAGYAGGGRQSLSVDQTAALTLRVTAQLATGTDTMSLWGGELVLS